MILTCDKSLKDSFEVASFLISLTAFWTSLPPETASFWTWAVLASTWFSEDAVSDFTVWTGALPRCGFTDGCIQGWKALVVLTLNYNAERFKHGSWSLKIDSIFLLYDFTVTTICGPLGETIQYMVCHFIYWRQFLFNCTCARGCPARL